MTAEPRLLSESARADDHACSSAARLWLSALACLPFADACMNESSSTIFVDCCEWGGGVEPDDGRSAD